MLAGLNAECSCDLRSERAWIRREPRWLRTEAKFIIIGRLCFSAHKRVLETFIRGVKFLMKPQKLQLRPSRCRANGVYSNRLLEKV